MGLQKTNVHNQITISANIAKKYGIKPGDYVQVEDAKDHIAIYPVDVKIRKPQNEQKNK